MHLASTVLYVADVPAVLKFYVEAFGFEIAFLDSDVDFPGRVAGSCCQFAELRLPGGTLQFATPALGALLMPGFDPAATSSQVELAFYTEAVAEGVERASRAGAEILRAPERMPWGQTVAYLRTPDGTFLALCTPPRPPG